MSNAPKQPSPLAAYLLLWATAGFYWLYWLHRMMTGINELNAQEVFAVRRIFRWGGAAVIGYYAILCSLSFVVLNGAPSTSLFLSGLGFGLACIAGFAYLHVRLARALNGLAPRDDKRCHSSSGMTVALFFCYFGVVPYLQSRWNRILASRT
jgi:hypothetical protein